MSEMFTTVSGTVRPMTDTEFAAWLTSTVKRLEAKHRDKITITAHTLHEVTVGYRDGGIDGAATALSKSITGVEAAMATTTDRRAHYTYWGVRDGQRVLFREIVGLFNTEGK